MTRKTLKNKLDKLCSQIIRSRGECAWCGESRFEQLQCCHIFSRNYMSVRFDFDNLVCLCAKHHFYSHLNPILFAEFVKDYLGKAKYEALKRKARQIKKWTPDELSRLLETYQEYQK